MTEEIWFKNFIASYDCNFLKSRPIVYFCAEYALNDEIPTYAGGLGVLAGDIIREAAEQNMPFTAVGLYYHRGYLFHDLYKDGIGIKSTGSKSPLSSNLTLVVNEQNKPVLVALPIQDTLVFAQAWLLKMGNVSVYLLDTNIPENEEENRQITDQLYSPSKEVRFKQEMVLGLGGLRLLEALNISPIGYHLNEGHSALLILEIARHEMKKHNRVFEEELENTKNHVFFTNHTLVPAGNDTYSGELVSVLLSGFAKELQVPVSEIIKLGLIADSNIFSMALLALRMAGKINAVSRIHAKKAQEIWKEYPMIPITNGIHVKTWDRIQSNEKIWEKHQDNKRTLLEYVNKVADVKWDENTLLLGWARRIVEYKRPFALFDKLQEFKELANSSNRQIRVIISGLSHENDIKGLEILEKMQKIVTEDLKDIVVYLPGYNMTSAKLLVSGCDVWLNTPVVGFEACGTSGMKAALNGVLPCTTADGWVAEANLNGVGWLLENENLPEDILAVLREQIIPLFYTRTDNGEPMEWIKMMKNARDMVLSQFTSAIMLKSYVEEFYLPNIQSHRAKI
jgi:glycogen phosphorylase